LKIHGNGRQCFNLFVVFALILARLVIIMSLRRDAPSSSSLDTRFLRGGSAGSALALFMSNQSALAAGPTTSATSPSYANGGHKQSLMTSQRSNKGGRAGIAPYKMSAFNMQQQQQPQNQPPQPQLNLNILTPSGTPASSSSQSLGLGLSRSGQDYQHQFQGAPSPIVPALQLETALPKPGSVHGPAQWQGQGLGGGKAPLTDRMASNPVSARRSARLGMTVSASGEGEHYSFGLSADDDVSAFGDDGGMMSARGSLAGLDSPSVYNTVGVHEEIARLQRALVATGGHSGPTNGGKLVSGSQFRAPLGLKPRCDVCQELDSKVKKGREALRSTKLLLSRAEERIKELLVSKEEHERFQSRLVHGTDPNQFEDQIARLTRKLEEKSMECSVQAKKLRSETDSRRDTERRLGEVSDQLVLVTSQVSSLEDEVTRLRAALNAAEQLASERKAALDAQRVRYEAALRDARAEGLASKAQGEREKQLLEELKDARRSIADLEETLARQGKQSETELDALRKRADAADAEVVKSRHEASVHDSRANRLDGQRAELALALDDLQRSSTAAIEQANNDATKALADWTSRESTLQGDKATLSTRLRDLLDRMQRDSENTTKALEKAISQSVRLCVVAPTVNVMIQDKKVSVKSSLAEAEMKAAITKHVIQPFSAIFHQDHDEEGPDGGDLGKYIQNMLAKMQGSIEAHVHSSLKNAPKS